MVSGPSPTAHANEVLAVDAESAYPTTTPGPRVRVATYAPFLRDHAVELRFSSHLSTSEYRVLSSAGHRVAKARLIAASTVRVARKARPTDTPLMVHRLLSLVPIPGRDPPAHVAVYDFDDALFHGSISSQNRSFRMLKRESERCHAYLRRARLVLAGNAYLASYARAYARRVEILPSCVDPASQPLRRHADAEIVTVGWIGSPSTAAYLQTILPVFADLNRDRVRLKLVTVGAGPLPPEPWLEQLPWTGESEAALLASFDIGVMPLPDTPWTRGKCGYKLLQYCAAGVPAVANPVGVNREILANGGGIAARSSADWKRALELFAADSAARREAGLQGRALVEREYSYQRWAPELAAMLRSVST